MKKVFYSERMKKIFMNVEEKLKIEADRRVNKLKNQCSEKGKIISESEEMYIRIGMSYGLSLASIGLGFLPSDITIDFEK